MQGISSCALLYTLIACHLSKRVVAVWIVGRMNRPDEARDFVELLAGRWTLAVLTAIVERGRRYQDIYDGPGQHLVQGAH